jgi:hypothetical protein
MKKNKDEASEPEVSVFGEKIKHKGRGGSGCISNGVFFIALGTMLLLNTLGVVPWSFWDHVWQFWPVLLILVGTHIVLGENLVSKIVTAILSVIVFSLIIDYGLTQVNSPLAQYFPQEAKQIINLWNLRRQ